MHNNEVKYNPHTKTESLVKGHWWAFNEKSAWRSIEMDAGNFSMGWK
jgi:hypothetical protein